MPRSKHKYHFIYKTTNLKNGKYYIGMHSTSNLNDGYLGSGDRLRRSIRKYAKENFKLEILEFFQDRESLANREKELVNENVIEDPMCMNIKPGGTGGFNNEQHQLKCSKAGQTKLKEKLKDPTYKAEFIKKTNCVETFKRLHKEGVLKPLNWKGKKHTEESIQKMKNSKKGKSLNEENSQFGSCWITNGIENKKIKKGDLILEGWYKGRVVTEEVKQKIKFSIIGKCKGIASTKEKEEERRKKISETMKKNIAG